MFQQHAIAHLVAFLQVMATLNGIPIPLIPVRGRTLAYCGNSDIYNLFTEPG